MTPIFESKSGHLWTSGALRTRFSCGRYCKKRLVAEVGIYMVLGSVLVIFGVIFSCFFDGFETNFEDFWSLGHSLECDGFSGLTLGTPRS